MNDRHAVMAAGAMALGLAMAAPDASADTLYKLIDKKGKVTYVEKAPKDFDGQVIRIDIDPNANTATMPRPVPPPAAPRAPAAPAKRPVSGDERVRLAQEKLDAAQQAFASARDNPRDEDVQWLGTVKGKGAGVGVRRVPTPEYEARLAVLEKAVKDAEEELRAAQAR